MSPLEADPVKTDVLFVGAGAAGLFATLHLPEHLDVVMVDKGARGEGSSLWAQGGVAAALAPTDSPELHAADTRRVAAGHANAAAVEVLCSEAPECVLELIDLGCRFDRTSSGELHLAREGGQSVARSAHSGDATGAAIMTTLRERAVSRMRRIEGSCVNLIVADGRCTGAWVLAEGELVQVRAASTVLATGGLGGLFASTTNPPGATGDGLALAWEAGAGLSDLEFVQFHPTALALGEGPQRPLLTEALRGAGAHVVDADGRRFLFEYHGDGELAPRDIVARAIASRHAWLDCRHIGARVLEEEFFTVVRNCKRVGLDPASDLLPVEPAAHYSIGGVQTDLDGRSSLPRLYAIGECSNTGVHGANRLAGNSLAEALVFGRRAARAIAGQRVGRTKSRPEAPVLKPIRVDLGASWSQLRSLCSAGLGMVRDGRGLKATYDGLEEWALLPLAQQRAALELRASAVTARLMARAASLRTESRGVHHRADHPTVDPGWAGIQLRLARG
ncbi:MAG: L-aspartate oxidase [Actinomycetota bacterium]